MDNILKLFRLIGCDLKESCLTLIFIFRVAQNPK